MDLEKIAAVNKIGEAAGEMNDSKTLALNRFPHRCYWMIDCIYVSGSLAFLTHFGGIAPMLSMP